MYEKLKDRIHNLILNISNENATQVHEDVTRAYEDCDITDEQFTVLSNMIRLVL